MKAKLLIDILSFNPEGEVCIVDWDKRKEIIVQINSFGQFELKTDGAVDGDNECQPIDWLE